MRCHVGTKARLRASGMSKADDFLLGIKNNFVAIGSGHDFKRAHHADSARMKDKVFSRRQMTRQFRQRQRRFQKYELGRTLQHRDAQAKQRRYQIRNLRLRRTLDILLQGRICKTPLQQRALRWLCCEVATMKLLSYLPGSGERKAVSAVGSKSDCASNRRSR